MWEQSFLLHTATSYIISVTFKLQDETCTRLTVHNDPKKTVIIRGWNFLLLFPLTSVGSRQWEGVDEKSFLCERVTQKDCNTNPSCENTTADPTHGAGDVHTQLSMTRGFPTQST